MDLESIPGVGKKTASALAELEEPERALRSGDVATIARAPGISDRRAARIAREAIRTDHDDPGGFLATDRARAIYRDILSLLRKRTETHYGAAKMATFYPSCRRSRIEDVREMATRAIERTPDPAVLDALSGVEPIEQPTDVRVRDRCLATTDAALYATAREEFPELSVEIIENERDIAELARGYARVIALDESFAGITLPTDSDAHVDVRPDALDSPVDVVPERPLAFFARNRDRIRAAIDVHRLAGLEPPCDLDELERGLSRLTADGSVVGDEELDRLSVAVDDLDTAVSTAENVANDRLRDAIRERDVTIEGSDLLSLVERGAGVDSLLTRELSDEYEAAVEAARDHLVDALALESGEIEIARRFLGDEPTFPVKRDDAVVSRLRETLTAAKERRSSELKRDLASSLAALRDDAVALVESALELDVELAIARFVADYECTMPTIVWEDSNDKSASSPVATRDQPNCDRERDRSMAEDVGIDIVGGRSPLLAEPLDEIDPVDYHVSGVTLLSGVNSGGKTSTLDLVTCVTILAHMGLPVPAERVRTRRFDALHYHAKTQGTLDAGAFESTVREFAALADGGDGRLVLVDELESITEPGASAKIIAGILEALDERETTAIFVTHLAAEIRDMTAFDVTIDGIEATGLVDGELQVNRSPVKNHLARSTPELIVEQLASEDDASFYDRLLDKFEDFADNT